MLSTVHPVHADHAVHPDHAAGRDDLLAFLLTAHAREGAEAVQAATNPADPPEVRLRAMVAAMIEYLGHHPGMCAGPLGALGATGRMSEALQINDTWIAGPLRAVLAEGTKAGAFAIDNGADATNAMIGAILLGVLGRSMAGADPTEPRFRRQLTEQTVRGVLT